MRHAPTFTIAVILLAGCSPAPNKSVPYTPTEAACLKKIAAGMQANLNADLAHSMANTDREIQAYGGKSGGPQAYDAAKADADYAEAKAAVQRNTAYCTQYAACFPSKPQRTVFNACYEVMGGKEPDPDDTKPEDGQ